MGDLIRWIIPGIWAVAYSPGDEMFDGHGYVVLTRDVGLTALSVVNTMAWVVPSIFFVEMLVPVTANCATAEYSM
jgi:hypothetical protein